MASWVEKTPGKAAAGGLGKVAAGRPCGPTFESG